MKKLMISHRGNLSGPYTCEENSPESILHAMECGYEVEIDLWKQGDDLFLGHDGPEYQIDKYFLVNYSNRLWIHCKNLHALEFCVKENLRCFSHDQDDAVLTSDKSIWRYPRYDLYVGEDTIIVLPEKCTTDDTQYLHCKGFCTDYPFVYSHFLPSLHSWLLDLEKIYHEISLRDFSPTYDPLLLKEDNRRCLALYTFLPLEDPVRKSITELREIIPNNIFYDTDARLHLTLSQVVPFSEYKEDCDIPLTQIGKSSGYVVFCGLILLPGSIALRGYPSFDINAEREKIGGSYKNDICHSTIVRFSRELTKEEQSVVREFVRKNKDTYYGSYDITSFQYGRCSWKMIEIENL